MRNKIAKTDNLVDKTVADDAGKDTSNFKDIREDH